MPSQTQKIPDRCKKQTKPFVRLELKQLVHHKRLGLISNSLYVLQAIQLRQPFRRVHVFRPIDFRRWVGEPWGGLMPERSFNQAIRDLCKKQVIQVKKDGQGWWAVALSHELFLYANPANPCREDGRPLPDSEPEPLPEEAFSAPKKEHDRILDLSYLKEQETEPGCCSKNSFFQEENRPRSEKPAKRKRSGEEHRHRSKKRKSAVQKDLDIAKNAELDLISAAISNSGGDGKYVEDLLKTRNTTRSELSALLRSLRGKSPQVIVDAVEAMREQEYNVRTPGKWLLRAMRDEWKPNTYDTKSAWLTPETIFPAHDGHQW